MHIIVLIFEVLYYSLFMKFARKEGKFYKYIILFGIISVFFFFVGNNTIYSYLTLILMMLYGLKFIVKLKITLHDMFIIFSMFVFKIIIEVSFGYSINFFLNNIDMTKIVMGLLKTIMTILLSKNINYLYNKSLVLWNNNNFYIRYIFNIIMIVYTIVALIFLIVVR